jgi:hypothetical protein
MNSSPERFAWIVLGTAFLVFCILAVGVPWGVRAYLTNASDVQEAEVEALIGTVVVEAPGSATAQPVVKGERVSVPEGSIIIVDETSEAAVTFFDHSSIRLFPDTRITLLEMRTPRYSFSSRSGRIALHENGGRIGVGRALSYDTPLEFEVRSLHAVTLLKEDGSYRMEVSNDRSEIIVTRGQAAVTAMGREVILKQRQRTVVSIGEPPLAPLPAAKDLVQNGAFSQPLDAGWNAYNDQGLDGGSVDGSATLVWEEGRRAVRFLRKGGGGDHCETGIVQEIDSSLPDPAISVRVRAQVMLRHQSLSGGGYLSSEYPLMIRLRYRDAYDSEAEWVRGFYYQNVANNPTTYGQLIQSERWYIYESENLLDVVPIKPSKIVSIQVYASGWDYESLISEIGLIVE